MHAPGRFHYHQLSLEHMTAAWLLPIVPAVVAAASGGLVASTLSPDLAFVTIAVSYMLWCASLPVLYILPLHVSGLVREARLDTCTADDQTFTLL